MVLMFKTVNLNHDGVHHGFLSAEGGVSEGIYRSLNCGFGSDDQAGNVAENRKRAVQLAGLADVPLVTCFQIHSSNVVCVEEPWAAENAPQADALVTRKPSIALGILTADCIPVLFADVNAGVVGAAHAGWKGAASGVLDATVQAMIGLGAKVQNIQAAIGPCIHQASYEVGVDLKENVMTKSPWAEDFFKDGKPDHFQFDLPGYVAGRLDRAGVKSVEQVNVDTYAHKDTCFSYRRTTHQGGGDYGRAISIIGLKG
ncbi:MAG: polyphenol oxidase [Rhodospirillaceae bacterium]|nr:MAG: polyphenol oxidase [Rhodospirillaceae bacterium]